MAVRPVFCSIGHSPFYESKNVDFQFYPGFSISQKQKSIYSLHKKYTELYNSNSVLEISSKSPTELGVALSAFNLMIDTKKRKFSVECAFQSSKVFQYNGPFVDLLDKTSKEAKKDERLHSSGRLVSFKYFDHVFPLEPKDYFYNWLYINALHLDTKLSNNILDYNCFTDIEFNPQKSINCQARAAAIYVGLKQSDLLNQALNSKEDFLRIVYSNYRKNPQTQLTMEF